MSLSDLPKLWITSSNISKFWFSKSFFSVENWSKLSNKFFSVKNIGIGEQLLLKVFFYFEFLKYDIVLKFAQFLSALFLILVGLTVTLFSEKCWFPLDAYMVSCPTWSKNLWRYLPSVSLSVSKMVIPL